MLNFTSLRGADEKDQCGMKILNFGSLNIDHVYEVDHFVRPGETLASKSYRRFSGGKGNNQAIALARAGAPRIIAAMRRRYPRAMVILTLGARGAVCANADGSVHVPGRNVKAVDTTAAGDTFIGYFLAAYTRSGNVGEALRIACNAAAICVTRSGAADSIPYRKEVAG